MDANEILKGIDEFLQTADEKALAEFNAALYTELPGDISIEEYLSGFANGYPYTTHCDAANRYESRTLTVDFSMRDYTDGWLEEMQSDYTDADVHMSAKMESEPDGMVAKMIKSAA